MVESESESRSVGDLCSGWRLPVGEEAVGPPPPPWPPWPPSFLPDEVAAASLRVTSSHALTATPVATKTRSECRTARAL